MDPDLNDLMAEVEALGGVAKMMDAEQSLNSADQPVIVVRKASNDDTDAVLTTIKECLSALSTLTPGTGGIEMGNAEPPMCLSGETMRRVIQHAKQQPQSLIVYHVDKDKIMSIGA